MKKRRVGPVSICVLDQPRAIVRILAKVEAARPIIVTFCNAHTVNVAAKDHEFARVLERSLVLNDGVGVDLASRLLFGRPFPANLNGTDFIPALLGSARSELRLFLLGSAPGVAEKAGEALKELGPGHRIVGTHHGFFSMVDEATLRTRILEANPNFILVGMGQPRQELWAGRNSESFPAVTMCVGAFLEFASGAAKRAPTWMRSARIEWLYRLVREPQRLWRRYLIGNVVFMARVFRERASRTR
ncbi:MAG TPA: WecB/TagA/CpsF family glycosyltransferase [Sphingomicrobium sp.]|nr:WecB/TagA/CpsF family glycosyltransferase [Sphingomicrobium sp.]